MKTLKIVLFCFVVLFFSACNNKQTPKLWASSYFYEICCDGTSSEYWNVVMTDSANNIVGTVYWSFKGETAAVRCHFEGDSANVNLVLDQNSTALPLKNLSKGTVLFRLERLNDAQINTHWLAVKPVCANALKNDLQYFSISQPETVGDPCAGENNALSENSSSSDDEAQSDDIVTDTAVLQIAWNIENGQFIDNDKANALINNSEKRVIAMTYSADKFQNQLTDKNPRSTQQFPVTEGVTSLILASPLPKYIINGNINSSHAWDKCARIKSVEIYWEKELVGRIELLDKPGIQYSKTLDSLRNQVSGASVEFEITSLYNPSQAKEFCISEIF